jgi:acyl-CoA carboxylase subunit beta
MSGVDAEDSAQFIQVSNQIDAPPAFLHNTTGYMVGAEYGQGGVIKDGVKMMNAVSNSNVPHLTS